MGVTATGWALTIGVIVALLALDLLLATVRPHVVGYREAAAWSAFSATSSRRICALRKLSAAP